MVECTAQQQPSGGSLVVEKRPSNEMNRTGIRMRLRRPCIFGFSSCWCMVVIGMEAHAYKCWLMYKVTEIHYRTECVYVVDSRRRNMMLLPRACCFVSKIGPYRAPLQHCFSSSETINSSKNLSGARSKQRREILSIAIFIPITSVCSALRHYLLFEFLRRVVNLILVIHWWKVLYL
jgi:hypothetical protein